MGRAGARGEAFDRQNKYDDSPNLFRLIRRLCASTRFFPNGRSVRKARKRGIRHSGTIADRVVRCEYGQPILIYDSHVCMVRAAKRDTQEQALERGRIPGILYLL